ncbi:hypothetical protein A9Q79_09795 [Methylophaga sp. 42_25_T18]|nr:hypothetical protein A9Q79_09795 [Methylophaga sp. 42_25_T18]OUR89952.1 hypothetical protein A9Q92_00110 [Methylophaga sp. 42_8_T64]
MKIAWFKFILIFPLIVFAAGEEGVVVDDAASETLNAGVQITNHNMIRTQGELDGYQPLTVAGQEVEATFLEETSGEEHGIIVFFHDQGDAFENKGITPLRHSLPEYGWSTLTVALDYPYEAELYLHDPNAVAREQAIGSENKAKEDAEVAKDAAKDKEPAWDDEEPEEVPEVEIPEEGKTEEANVEKLPPVSNIERLEAVLSFIQAKNVERIVFVGHGKGGEKAVELLGQITTPISALVLIGTSKFASDEVWKTFEFPVLDIYGTNDFSHVASAVEHRKTIMRRIGSKNYESRKVIGADHVFYGLQPQLVSMIRRWLHRIFLAPIEEVSALDGQRPLVPVAR